MLPLALITWEAIVTSAALVSFVEVAAAMLPVETTTDILSFAQNDDLCGTAGRSSSTLMSDSTSTASFSVTLNAVLSSVVWRSLAFMDVAMSCLMASISVKYAVGISVLSAL